MTMTNVPADVHLSEADVDLVAAHGPASDESGHLDPAVVEALRSSGINRLFLPVELGGFSASPRRAVEVVERLSAADGSSGWAAAIGFGTSLFAGYLDPDGAAEVFADPDLSNASMFAPLATATEREGGGWTVTGRWPFTSNCEQAAWVGLGVVFSDEPAPRLVFAPRDATTIHATWDVAGMRATASNDVSLTDFPVDRRHSCSFADRAWASGPLWRLPMFGALAPPLAAVALGIARGALDEINGQAIARRARMRGTLLDDPLGMSELGAADADLRAARAGLMDLVDQAWAIAEDGGCQDRALQARGFLAAQHCLEVAVTVASTCHRLGGGAAAYRSSPLSRAVRDLETARQHAMFNRGLRAPLARAIAGTDEALPPFVL